MSDELPYREWPGDWQERFWNDPDLWLRADAHVSDFVGKHGGPLCCIDRLSRGWRMVLSIVRLSGQVNNGGFQSLWYYYPWTVAPSINGFRLIGAEKLALLLETVHKAADWSGEWNGDRDSGGVSGEDDVLFNRLYCELDNAALPGGYDLGALVNAFILAHPQEFGSLK